MTTTRPDPDTLRDAAYRAHAVLDQLVHRGDAPRDVIAAHDELAAALGIGRGARTRRAGESSR